MLLQWWSAATSALESLSRAQVAGVTFVSLAVLVLEVWAIVRAVTRGHGVQGTLAWLFSILAFPMIGALAFFALASPSVRRITLKRRRATAQLRRGIADEAGAAGARPSAAAHDGDSLLDLAASLTELQPTAGNVAELLTDNELTFERIEAALRSAQKVIWAEYYIIRNDETGRRFLELLAERARAGVEVRLLYDALGSIGIDAHLLEGIVAAGGKARAFQPMNPLKRRFAVHLRNHRKLIVVDGEVGFTGGMNVGDEYSGRRRRSGVRSFRDSHLELRGPSVGSMAQVFREDWAFSGGGALPRLHTPVAAASPGSLVAIVPSGPDQEHNASAFVHFAAIASARKRVWLSSGYFIPDESTMSALVSAALRRVDVRVLLPALSNSDVKLAALAARWYYGKLLRGGVRIFEYEPSMLHGKTLVADGQIAVVGSANVDLRSYRLNFEVGALVNDAKFASVLERRFVGDVARAVEVTLEMLARQGRWRRTRCTIARLLSPLL
ncbi:MAG: cardiolipin synthase [Planctomycetes bacterium]|nr:cardiolipin synthase [Planctomycetota bacterium]